MMVVTTTTAVVVASTTETMIKRVGSAHHSFELIWKWKWKNFQYKMLQDVQ